MENEDFEIDEELNNFEDENYCDDELDEENEELENVSSENENSKTNENNNIYLKIIEDYLLSQIKTDEGLKSNFIPNTIDFCFDFIKSNAQKKAVNGCAMISDDEVFKWSRDFYNDGIAKEKLNEEKEKIEKKAKQQKEKEEKERKEKEKTEFYERCKKLYEEHKKDETFKMTEKEFEKNQIQCQKENENLKKVGQLELF